MSESTAMNKKVYGYHIANKLNIAVLQRKLVYDAIKVEPTELLLKTENNGLISIFNYGSIVFIDVEQHEQVKIMQTIRHLLELPDIELKSEAFDIEVDATRSCMVLFNKLIVDEWNEDLGQIIMLNIAQSVAMDFYMQQAEKLMEETRQYTTRLEMTGKLGLRGRTLLKFIGRVLNLKNGIVENLYVFDSPKMVWDDQKLNRLDTDLSRELDMQIRYKNLQENLSIIKENLDLFKDVSQHSHSSLLEWIIILLILVEVINMVLEKIF